MPKGKIERQLLILLNGEPRWYNEILIEQLGARYRETFIELIQRDRAKLKKLHSKLLEQLPEDLEVSLPETTLLRLEALLKEEPHVTGKDVIPFLEKLSNLKMELFEAAFHSLREQRRAQEESAPAHPAPTPAGERAGEKTRLPRSSAQTIRSCCSAHGRK